MSKKNTAANVMGNAVDRFVDRTDRETGETVKVRQVMMDVLVPQKVLAVSGAVSLLQEICRVVYPLGNSWVAEVTEATDWDDLSAKFAELKAREPEEAGARPQIGVEADLLWYVTASGTASLKVGRFGDSTYGLEAEAWQPEKGAWPLVYAAKKVGLKAVVRQRP